MSDWKVVPLRDVADIRVSNVDKKTLHSELTACGQAADFRVSLDEHRLQAMTSQLRRAGLR
jgi:hypothetical protein